MSIPTILTAEQAGQVMSLYHMLGEKPFYRQLPHGLKRCGASAAIAAVLQYDTDQLNDAVQNSPAFRATVEDVILAFELVHPGVEDVTLKVMEVVHLIASAGMQMDDGQDVRCNPEGCIPDGDIDSEFAAMVEGFEL